MGLNRRKLTEWVCRKLVSLPMATRFTLWHEAKHGRHLVSHLTSDGLDPDDVASDVERQVSDEAGGHIEAWPGRQQYVVRAYANDEEIGEYPFSLDRHDTVSAVESLALPTPEMEYQAEFYPSGGYSVSSPSAARVESQQMRHNEVLVRALVEQTTRNYERDERLIASLQRANEKHEARRFEQVELLEEMYSRRQERSLLQQQHVSDAQRKERLVTALTTMVFPALASKAGSILGGVGPTGPSPRPQGADATAEPTEEDDLQTLAHIFMTLPSEKQSEFMEALSPDCQVQLLNIIRRAGARANHAAPDDDDDAPHAPSSRQDSAPQEGAPASL
jgi:hypothetical protein